MSVDCQAPSVLPVHPKAVGFLDLLQAYPIFSKISSFLAVRETVFLSRTCKALSHLHRTLLSSNHWDVDRDLRRFVKDPRRLRQQLGQHNALISGSFALQFFERVTWEKSDLDIFLGHGEVESFKQYLVEEEGYRLVSDQIDYGMEALLEVRCFDIYICKAGHMIFLGEPELLSISVFWYVTLLGTNFL